MSKLFESLTIEKTKLFAGDHEPTDVECEFPSDSEDDEAELSQDVKDKVSITTHKISRVN